MKKILSERNLVVILFIAALTVFSFAQEDAKKLQKIYQGNTVESSFINSPKQTAGTTDSDHKDVLFTSDVK